MKNSAWYHKLWRKKLDELPVKEDAHLGWKGMKDLLDEQLPINGSIGNSPVNSFWKKLIASLSYIITAAAIIGTAAYFTLHTPAKHKAAQIKKKQQYQSYADTSNTIRQILNSLSAKNNLIDTANLAATETDKKQAIHTGHQENQTTRHGLKETTKAGHKFKPIYSSVHSKGNIVSANEWLQKNERANRFKKNSWVKGKTNFDSSQGNSLKHYSLKEKRPTKTFGIPIPDKANNPAPLARQLNFNSRSASQTKVVPDQNNFVQGKGQDKSEHAIVNNKIMPSLNSGGKVALTVDQNGKKDVKDNTKNKTLSIIEKSAKSVTSNNKQVKSKQPKVIHTPKYNLGFEAGLNASSNSSFYLGGFGSYALKPRLLLNVGIRLNTTRTIAGEYSHPSYYRPDSLPPFKIIDARKLLVLDLPVTIEYKFSNVISINAGPIIGLSVRQSGNGKLGPITDLRDTVYHTKEINNAISNTGISKVNMGFTGGVNFHIRKFDLEGKYQLLMPYKISNNLGSYRKTYQALQLGIKYSFK